jgi:deoxyribonuclease IV
MKLGLHVSTAGHIYEAVNRAAALGCNTMQIFSRDPLQWRKSHLTKEDTDEFLKLRAQHKITPVFAHVSYLINLASPYNILYRSSVKAYIEDIKEAQNLGIEYIVTHMGSHKESGEEKGLKRITAAINRILDKTKDHSVVILLENTAGSGSWLGYTFEHQRRVIDKVENKARVGICFDTCHGFAAGYDLSTSDGYKKTISQLDDIVGIDKLKLIHLNDSKDKLSSHRDRHEHIGKGEIGLEGFRRLVNDPRLADVSFILETPKDAEGDELKNLEAVRKLRKAKE